MGTLVIEKLARLKREITAEINYLHPKSRPRKILFNHLPKCGGSSFNAHLQTHYPVWKTFSIDGNKVIPSVNKFKLLPQRKRYKYDLVKGHNAHHLLDFVHPECLKITIFREPVDRLISHYFYAKRKRSHYLHSRILESGMSLEEYATSDLDDELRNWYTTHFSGLPIDYADKHPEEAVEKAIDTVLNRYDIVGLLDNFSSFAKLVQDQAMLKYRYQNKKYNVTSNRPATKDILQRTIRVIEEVNYLDVIFYNKIKEGACKEVSS